MKTTASAQHEVMETMPNPVEPNRIRDIIRVRDVSRVFEQGGEAFEAISGFNLDVQTGEFVALLGPSGCGKSTILNMVAGLLTASEGTVEYKSRPVPMPNTEASYMTQTDSLLPWRTVSRNIRLPLIIRGEDRDVIDQRVTEMIELVGLTGFENAYPSELSGGMRKRAMLARTLIYSPDVALFDEPFGALDAHLKLQMQAELLRIYDRARPTIVFVTHDLDEALTLADRVVVVSRRPGRVRLNLETGLARPRDVLAIRGDKRYQDAYAELWDALAPEMGVQT